jgi:hypothetical protein
MKRPTTIEAFLQEFDGVLALSGHRRRRVVDEARDHLIEVKERGIRAGLDPSAAEVAAIEAFGDPAEVASRFEPGLRARLSRAVDRYDRWRADHPTAGITLALAPMALVIALAWSPLAALSFLPMWATFLWIGQQLKGRQEPGYRHRLWGWKQDHPVMYQVATNLGGMLAWAACLALQMRAGTPHVTPWLFLVLLPLIPLGWILNAPRRYRPPATPAA